MGYVITGALALALGVLITLTCIHYKKYKEMEKEDK